MDKFIFTAKGLEYAAKTATGSVLMFTKGKFGSGTTSGDVANLTNLINPLGELQISKKTVTENQVTIETQFRNTVSDSATLPPFHLTEIGLFAKLQTSGGADDSQYPETLVCYAHVTGSDAGDYIPSTPTEFIINWPFSVSNADNVQISYSEHESGIYSLGVQMVGDNYYDLPIRADSPVFIVSIAAKSGDDSEIYNSQGLLYADGTCYERIRYLWFMTSGQQRNPQFGEWSTDCQHISRGLFRLDS